MKLISVGGDWTKNTPHAEYPYAQSVYEYFDAVEQVENSHFPNEKHGYERQATGHVSLYGEASRFGLHGSS